MGDEDDEEESDAIVTQVLDELGLQLTDELAGAAVPSGTIGTTVKATGGKQAIPAGAEAAGGGGGGGGGAAAAGGGGGTSDADADLQARLDDLRRE